MSAASASSAGYTIAVPTPSRTAPPIPLVNGTDAPPAMHASAIAWMAMPHTISGRTGRELSDAPRQWIHGLDDADVGNTQAIRGEEERQNAPRDPVVQIVDQARLARAKHHTSRLGRFVCMKASGRVRRVFGSI